MKGFTLIELLVVVAIIALLISILLPSLQHARKQAAAVACMSNLDQVNKALRMYQDEHDGWLPQSYNRTNPYDNGLGSLWSEAAWGVAKKDLWFYKLAFKYASNPRVFACPGDPLLSRFDFEARDDNTVPACGYGMSYFLRQFSLPAGFRDMMHAEGRFMPARPSETILLAEVGPDDGPELAPLYGGVDGGDLGTPWRDGGRLLWDDGERSWYDGPTWLTARHLGKINMSTYDNSVRRVTTRKQLQNRIQTLYRFNSPFGDCHGKVPGSDTFVCILCENRVRHYTFADSQLWWWTGPLPDQAMGMGMGGK